MATSVGAICLLVCACGLCQILCAARSHRKRRGRGGVRSHRLRTDDAFDEADDDDLGDDLDLEGSEIGGGGGKLLGCFDDDERRNRNHFAVGPRAGGSKQLVGAGARGPRPCGRAAAGKAERGRGDPAAKAILASLDAGGASRGGGHGGGAHAQGRAAYGQPHGASALPPVRVTFDWGGVTKQGAMAMDEMHSVSDLLQVTDVTHVTGTWRWMRCTPSPISCR